MLKATLAALWQGVDGSTIHARGAAPAVIDIERFKPDVMQPARIEFGEFLAGSLECRRPPHL
jgi:hypothetical protein